MATIGKKFVGNGAAYTSAEVNHAGGDLQLLVVGAMAGASVWLEKEYQLDAAEYRVVPGSTLREEGGVTITLKQGKFKLCASSRGAGANFGAELITV